MSVTTSRLLQLLSLLQVRRDWPGSLLAARLEVSARTVRRDIERLRDMGYAIAAAKGPDGGYRLGAGETTPPLLFDDDQVLAVSVALQAATVAGAGIGEDALRALTTVRQVIPPRLRPRLDALEITAIPGAAYGARIDVDVLLTISAAIRSCETLRFDYADQAARSEGEPRAPLRVEPHHIATLGGRWYLVGWDPAQEDWRIFRVDRVSPRVPNGPRFIPRPIPGGDVAEFVAARFKGSADVNRWPCTGTVVLHRPAAEVRPFADGGIVAELDSDRCTLEAGSWSWIALAAALNRFDTDIEVVEPPELVDAFAELARRNAATASAAT
jgi:predicted DNA-binding transcriptional regulator YafY